MGDLLNKGIEKRNRDQLINMGMQGAALAMSGPAGPNLEPLQQQYKTLGQSVDDVGTKLDTEKKALTNASEKDLENPNSPVSKFVNSMLGKLGYADMAKKGMSAGQLKRAGIDVDKMMIAHDRANDMKFQREVAMKHRDDLKDPWQEIDNAKYASTVTN